MGIRRMQRTVYLTCECNTFFAAILPYSRRHWSDGHHKRAHLWRAVDVAATPELQLVQQSGTSPNDQILATVHDWLGWAVLQCASVLQSRPLLEETATKDFGFLCLMDPDGQQALPGIPAGNL